MRPRDAASALGGLAALAMAVLAVGGATRWSQALVAALVAVALVPIVLSRRYLGRMSPLLAIFGIAAALTTLQVIPVPAGLVELLNPTGQALREEGVAVAEVSTWNVLSMDAPGSIRALIAYLTLLGLAALALRVAVSESGRFRLVATVGIVCGVSAAIVGVHEVLDERSLYGMIAVKHGPHLIGPLFNLNHLGSLMAIGTVVGIGLASYANQASWARAAWLVVAAACGGIAVYTVSRGATLAMISGALVTVGLVVAQRFTSSEQRRRGSFLTNSLPIAVVATCAVVLVIYSSAGAIEHKFAHTSLDEIHSPKSKFAAWRSSATLIEESPWIGVGRGGFEPSFTRLHPTSGQLVFSHLENEYLQAVVDWGIPGALLLGLAGVWLAVVVVRRWRDGPLAAAAIGGMVVLVVQSNVDFGAEMLGLAAPVTLLAAAVAYVPLREAQPRELRRARVLRIVHVAALAAGAVLLISSLTTTIEEDHEYLRGGEASSMSAAIAESISRHPHDYYGYAVAAELAFRRGDAKGVRLLNHALRLNPSHGGLHLIAARRLLRGKNLDQSAMEYSAALRYSPTPAKVLRELVSELPRELAAKAIPVDMPDPRAVITILAEAEKNDVAAAWLARILELQPNHTRTCELLVSRIHDGDATVAELAHRRCPSAFLDSTVMLSLTQKLASTKKFDELITLTKNIENARGSIEDKHRAWIALCDAYRARARWTEATTCLRSLDGEPSVPPEYHVEIKTRLELVSREAKAAGGSAAP